MKRDNFLIGALFAVVQLASFPGCGRVADPYRAPVPAGRIQGRVSGGEASDRVGILAYPVIDGATTYEHFGVPVEEDGRYSIDVPAGRYVLRLDVPYGDYYYAAPTPSYGQVPPDTLTVGGGSEPIVADFPLAAFVLDLAPSHLLDGEYVDATLHLRDQGDVPEYPANIDHASAEVVDGRCMLTIPYVFPGEYRIELVLGTYGCMCGGRTGGEVVWLPGTHDPEAATWYAAPADTVVQVAWAASGEPARIEGACWGRPWKWGW